MNVDTLTVRQLREELARLPAFDSDLTNIAELRIKSGNYHRVQLVSLTDPGQLTDELKNLLRQVETERQALAEKRAERKKLTASLRRIREQLRTRKPNLP